MKFQFTAGPVSIAQVEKLAIDRLTADGAFIFVDLDGAADPKAEVSRITSALRIAAGKADLPAHCYAINSVLNNLTVSYAAAIKVPSAANDTAETTVEANDDLTGSHSLPTGSETTSQLSQESDDTDTNTNEELNEYGKSSQPGRRARRS